jgi:hypothetical protein
MKTRNTRSKKNKRPKKPETRGRSGYEQKVMEFLESQGVLYGYEIDTVQYIVPETKRKYIPDFTIERTGILIEAKGLLDASARKKMKMVVEQNPGLKIKMLFQRDNPIRKGSKVHYSDWARKLGIDFAVSPSGSVPLRWIKG